MNDEMNLLEIRDLAKRYDDFELAGVSLAVPAGSVVGFIGENGAGKTTTIKALLGLIRPDAGSIALFGEETVGAPDARLAQLKQDIGVVFDTCALPEELPVRTVGRIMRSAYRTWDDDLFAHYLRALSLPADKTVKDLSRGMGMKLSLACALAHRPRLLVLDEATAGLDPIAREEALDLLRAFVAEGDGDRGILMSSHITSDLEKIADYIVCIEHGRVAFSIEKDLITDQAGIAQCRSAEFAALAESGLFAPGTVRFEHHAYGVAALVPDRFAFAEHFPHVAVERASIDAYMNLMLKGEAL